MIRNSKCGEVPALVHAVRALLAAGLAGAGRLSTRVDSAPPLRLVGIAVDGVFGLLRGVVMLPARLVSR